MSGKWSKQSRAYHESMQAHVSARMREAVEQPTKRDLQEMLAEAIRNTARIELPAEPAI